jgi:maleylacetate reductase
MTLHPTSFVQDSPPPRVVFGAGRVSELEAEVDRLGEERVLIVATRSARSTADRVADVLGTQLVARIEEVAMHVPGEAAAAAVTLADEVQARVVVSIGGGSAIGLAKILALRVGLPYLAVPTTYAGSEMTPIWGHTQSSEKVTGRADAVLPGTVIYDPELTVTLSPRQSAASGMNALAHALEALYAPDATPDTDDLSVDGILLLTQALPVVVANPSDLAARSAALQGAWLCGRALGATRTGLHHAICHVLGGRFGLPHSATHAAVLPHVVAWNQASAQRALAKCTASLGESPGAALWDLGHALGAPQSLAEAGLADSQIEEAAHAVVTARPTNPREVTRQGVAQILRAALDGSRPHPST